MKNALWISLLLLLLSPVLTHAQGKAETEFEAQREIVYKVSSAARLPAAIAWYTAFFGREPTLVDNDARNPFARFNVDGMVVRLETNPKYIKLKEPLFYWMLPTPEAVVAKLALLRKDPANTVTSMRDLGSLPIKQRSGNDNADEEQVKKVVGFTVSDPEGNQVGIINNPIYVPSH